MIDAAAGDNAVAVVIPFGYHYTRLIIRNNAAWNIGVAALDQDRRLVGIEGALRQLVVFSSFESGKPDSIVFKRTQLDSIALVTADGFRMWYGTMAEPFKCTIDDGIVQGASHINGALPLILFLISLYRIEVNAFNMDSSRLKPYRFDIPVYVKVGIKAENIAFSPDENRACYDSFSD